MQVGEIAWVSSESREGWVEEGVLASTEEGFEIPAWQAAGLSILLLGFCRRSVAGYFTPSIKHKQVLRGRKLNIQCWICWHPEKKPLTSPTQTTSETQRGVIKVRGLPVVVEDAAEEWSIDEEELIGSSNFRTESNHVWTKNRMTGAW